MKFIPVDIISRENTWSKLIWLLNLAEESNKTESNVGIFQAKKFENKLVLRLPKNGKISKKAMQNRIYNFDF